MLDITTVNSVIVDATSADPSNYEIRFIPWSTFTPLRQLIKEL